MEWKYVLHLYKQRKGLICVLLRMSIMTGDLGSEPCKVLWVRASAKYLQHKMRARA